MLKLEFLRNPTFAAANVVAFATNLSVFSVFFFTALYLQLITDFSGYQIALVFTSLAVAMIVAGLIAGRWTAARRAAGADGDRVPARRTAVCCSSTTSSRRRRASPRSLWPLAIAGLGFGIALVDDDRGGARPRSARAVGHGGVDREHEPRARRSASAVAVLGAVVNAQLTSGLNEKLVHLHIPLLYRNVVIEFVTTGGNVTSAENSPGERPHGADRQGAARSRGLGRSRRPPLASDRRRDRSRGGRRRGLRCAA